MKYPVGTVLRDKEPVTPDVIYLIIGSLDHLIHGVDHVLALITYPSNSALHIGQYDTWDVVAISDKYLGRYAEVIHGG